MLRLVFTLAALLALMLGGVWLVTAPPPARPTDTVRVAPSVRVPNGGAADGLHTPLGDALFRWRCTIGLRDALGARTGWPLERMAGLCLCIADRMREDGLREVPQFSGGDATAALEAAEATLCRPR